MASDENVKDIFLEKLEEIKSQLNSDVTKNPKFDTLFLNELRYFLYKTANLDSIIVVSSDKNSVSIINDSPLVNCALENRSFMISTIKLSDNNLFLETAQGTLFERKKVEGIGLRTFAFYESKYETMYTFKCYNKAGIEYSSSSFQDSYPLSQKINDIDLNEQTLSSFHKPIFYEFSLPKAPIHVLKGIARNTYRKEGSYGVIHNNACVLTKDGYQDVRCSLYSIHPMFPDLLRGNQIIAKSICHNGRYIFIPENNFAPSIEEAYEKVKNELKKELQENKKDIPKPTYKSLMENI